MIEKNIRITEIIYKSRIIIVLLFIVVLFVLGIFNYRDYCLKKQQFKDAIISYNYLYKDENNLKSDITIEMVQDSKIKIMKIVNQSKKKELLENIEDIENYVLLRDQINDSYNGDIMKSSVDQKMIDDYKKEYNNLKKSYQKLLKNKIEDMECQLNLINSIILEVDSLFVDLDKNEVKGEVDRNHYNEVINKLNQLKQEDVKNNQLQYLKKVETTITNRELEHKRKLEEERKRREKEIENAWIRLNVPYVSQNNTGVYNGCEVASLLMCLKYKGYLANMDINTYATNVPKSNDPNLGFVHDIFGLEPRNFVHWISPQPLVNYGISSSGNNNIINTTGYSIDQLDNELSNNNPIVIYLTNKLKSPKDWQGEVPLNLHVLVLSGYNKITGQHIITDPWTKNDGTYTWYISKTNLEAIYNSVGKKSIVVR